MILRNPTNSDVSIVYKGELLTVKANKDTVVTEEQGVHWSKVHQFLEIINAPKAEIKEVKEVIEPVVEATEVKEKKVK